VESQDILYLEVVREDLGTNLYMFYKRDLASHVQFCRINLHVSGHFKIFSLRPKLCHLQWLQVFTASKENIFSPRFDWCRSLSLSFSLSLSLFKLVEI